jgi:hypothetical protein
MVNCLRRKISANSQRQKIQRTVKFGCRKVEAASKPKLTCKKAALLLFFVSKSQYDGGMLPLK